VRKICAKADEISSPHHCLTNSLPSKEKFIFLHNRWTEFYEPSVIPEARGDAKTMAVGSRGSMWN
jgi:hypothetical protein